MICHLKHSAQPKLKVYFLKNALENINERVKGVFLIKQIYYNFFNTLQSDLILTLTRNIETMLFHIGQRSLCFGSVMWELPSDLSFCIIFSF